MKRSIRLIGAFITAFAFNIIATVCSHAQARDINSFMSGGKNLLKQVEEHAVDIALGLVGLVGLIMVVPNLIKHSKNDPNASDAFIRLGTGLVAAFVLIQLARLLF